MATESRSDAAVAISEAISSSADHLYEPPEQRRWRMDWARYWCFKSPKRERRIVPSTRSEGGGVSGPVGTWPISQPGLGLAPPSSPASFINSSVQSPASFSLSLNTASTSMCSPGPVNTMFTIGPYAHETQLVSPPVFSTFTTEPNTAPFTPPPELAHLTTPSSPDVPFAQYIASSLESKSSRRENISPLSTSTMPSPCDTPACYTPISGHMYLGSPFGHHVSPPTSDFFGKEKEFLPPRHHHPMNRNVISSFPTFDPFASATFDGVPFASFILPCEASDPSQSGVICHDSNQSHEEDVSGSNDIDGKDIKSKDLVGLDLMHEPLDLSNEKVASGLIKDLIGNVQGQSSASEEGHGIERGWFDMHAFHGTSKDDEISLAVQYEHSTVLCQK